ncbi:MAG: hypothetical protein ACN6RH_15740 [Stenotrophomonas rhizophila]|uniref:hypothetical protein n=1 Tax=Stenotrophomonas rhizophila TaxID=216778 RepID=UPI003D11FA25
MNMPALLTTKPLLWAIGILSLAVIALAVCLVVVRASARADAATYEGVVAACTAQKSGATTRVAELASANAGYARTVAVLQAELLAAQAQALTLKRQSDGAVAAAQAREADANTTLKQFMNRYAGQARETRCALALTEVEASCPAFSGY